MTPKQLIKKNSEHEHQVAFFAYCAIAKRYGWQIADKWAKIGAAGLSAPEHEYVPVPALEWIHAIPNGGARGDSEKSRRIRGGALKAEGVRDGVSDIFLPYPNAGWHGLYIEMKRPGVKPKSKKAKKGGMSNRQLAFKEYVVKLNYGFMCCYSWREAANIVKEYIEYTEVVN